MMRTKPHYSAPIGIAQTICEEKIRAAIFPVEWLPAPVILIVRVFLGHDNRAFSNAEVPVPRSASDRSLQIAPKWFAGEREHMRVHIWHCRIRGRTFPPGLD